MKIKYPILVLMFALAGLTSCGEYYALEKTSDYEYRYEAAKAYFVRGKYARAAELLTDLLPIYRGTAYGEETQYMLAQAEYCARDYETAGTYFKKYYQTYPKGSYVEHSRYYSAMSQFMMAPDIRLDQTATTDAVREFQNFVDLYPYTKLKDQVTETIYDLQDRLVEKELLNAQLYYNLGTYVLNSLSGGSNYEACIVTAQNALKDYPYAKAERREELAILILRGKYQLAKESVEEKRVERFRDAIDEYYAFTNDFPESKYLNEAKNMLKHSEQAVKGIDLELNNKD